MNAIDLLKSDHLAAKRAIEEISNSPAELKKKLFGALKKELEVHDHIEETIFYPSVKTHPKTSSFIVSDKDAHGRVEKALDELLLIKGDDSRWMPKFDAMAKALLDHINDEETRLFVAIREVMSDSELNEMGKRMLAEKERQIKAGPLVTASHVQEGQ